jgi:hypothetical protein
MSSDEEDTLWFLTQIIQVRALELNYLYEKVAGEDDEYKLPDGTKIQLIMDVDTISRIIDPMTNRPAVNPRTGEPMYNISLATHVDAKNIHIQGCSHLRE